MMKKLIAIFAIAFMVAGLVNAGETVSDINWQTDDVSWTQMPNVMQNFYRSGAAVLGNYMFVFGTPTQNYAQAFNYVTEQWEIATPPLFGNMHHAAVATETDIYLIGRQLGNSFNTVQKFTPLWGTAQGTWTEVANYPMEAAGVSAAWDGGNYIYAAGGTNFTSYDEAYRYDIAADVWTPIALLPNWKTHAGGYFLQGKFYIVGGYYNQHQLLEYDPLTDTWTEKAEIPIGISHSVGCVSGTEHLLYVVGGGGPYFDMPPVDTVQIYNPYTDTWSFDTPLPAALSMNAAKYVGNGTVICAGGTRGEWNYNPLTFKGTGFPEGGPPIVQDIEVNLTPENPPITIPANGGSFNFNIELVNNEPAAVTLDVWTYVTLPNGQEYGPIINVNDFTINTGATVNRDRIQVIPTNAPSGEYTYDAYVGLYPNFIWDEDHFDFSKSVTDNGGEIVSEWDSWGISSHDSMNEGITESPEEYIMLSAYPNPFNPETTISFSLPNASKVSLAVYDIQGKEITTLVEGAYPAGTYNSVFNASDLASGIYFVSLRAGNLTQTQKLMLIK